MIIGILIILILSQVISIALIIQIGKNQETNFQISAKVQVDQWEDIVQIERRVRAIDKKIELHALNAINNIEELKSLNQNKEDGRTNN